MVPGDESGVSSSGVVSYKPFEAARLSLARLGLPRTEEIERAVSHVAQIAAEAMQVQRVGVWLCEQGGDVLHNVYVHDSSSQRSGVGEWVMLDRWPRYHEAIQVRRVVAVADTTRDPRTTGMEGYLAEHRIGALLDAPIYLDGDLVGVLCIEHIGARREWSQSDVDFGVSVAEVLATVIQQARRLKAEEELRIAHEELVKSESRHALARLAAGVAHDLNNLLTIISLNVSSLPTDGPAAHLIEEQCQVGARLARQLLAFARERPPQVQDLDLPEVIRTTRSLLASALGPACPLELKLTDEPLLVHSDRAEIEQILLNLAVNARSAMPHGGTFTLAVRAIGNEVVLWASDQGVGIPEPVRDRIFDPFFTTRRESGGSGMGLAIVQAAMHRAGGSVEVSSVEGHGTTFTLRWPRIAADAG